jgi:hypothetical protein
MRSFARGLPRALALLFATPLLAQQPGPEKDSRPLERPQPLCILTLSNTSAALGKVSDVVKAEKFKIDSINWNTGELHASREDNSSRSDRVVIWLESDCQPPGSKTKLYLLYGRFAKFYGEAGAARVAADEALEKERIGPLKEKLIALSFPGGPP